MLTFPAKEHVEKLRSYMAEQGIDVCLLSSPENMEYPVAVWHGFVGAAVTKDIFLIDDPIVYNASE